MNRSELRGKIQTVLGLISPSELGITMMHEHLIVDTTPWLKTTFGEPEDPFEREMINRQVTTDNLWWFRYHPFQNYDDCQLLDEGIAIDEVFRYKELGGMSILDPTVVGTAPIPAAIARISHATAVNVIMGTGYYVEPSYPSYANIRAKSLEEIADEFVSDIKDGFGKTGIHAGIIGELGCTSPLTDNEKKVLRAGALAQRKTGAALTVHPGREERAPIEILQILDQAGADLSRTIMCHIDRGVRKFSTRLEIAETGCYLEYDMFGREGYYPSKFHVIDLPNDAQRINELMELSDKGYQDKLLLSQDICNKTALCRYGGWGYGHILRDAVPVMKIKGIPRELIDTWLIENPKRVLTFE